MTPKKNYWNEIESIWDQVSIYDGPDAFLNQYSQVTQKQQILFATHWAQSVIKGVGVIYFGAR